jgi:hypothetical protein
MQNWLEISCYRISLIAPLLLLFSTPSSAQWYNGYDMHNTTSGNVGIGTSAPMEKLTVVGSVKTQV